MDPRASLLGELFAHIIEGYDIPTPAGLLKVSEERAATKHEGSPYSLLKNLAHAVYWQNLWLDRLQGRPTPPTMEIWKGDWQEPSPTDFKRLRQEFVEGLEMARKISTAEPFEHAMDSDEKAIDRLLRIAVHGAYHMGQMNLLKRWK